MPRVEGTFKHRILLVDDDEALLASLSALLTREGYLVVTAHDGFEALAAMRDGVPDLLISDLRMPNMSGFELLGVVRRRFPSIAVIAMSDEFRPATLPVDLLADRFLPKDGTPPMEILETVRELLAKSPLRSQPAKSDVAPVWVPRSLAGYIVLTCPECLRSFSVPQPLGEGGISRTETCAHCEASVQYYVDATVLAQPIPGRSRIAESRKAISASKQAIESSRQLMAERKGHKHKR